MWPHVNVYHYLGMWGKHNDKGKNIYVHEGRLQALPKKTFKIVKNSEIKCESCLRQKISHCSPMENHSMSSFRTSMAFSRKTICCAINFQQNAWSRNGKVCYINSKPLTRIKLDQYEYGIIQKIKLVQSVEIPSHWSFPYMMARIIWN